jgi:hypothetical protein
MTNVAMMHERTLDLDQRDRTVAENGLANGFWDGAANSQVQCTSFAELTRRRFVYMSVATQQTGSRHNNIAVNRRDVKKETVLNRVKLFKLFRNSRLHVRASSTTPGSSSFAGSV